jgi:hypothetical protein
MGETTVARITLELGAGVKPPFTYATSSLDLRIVETVFPFYTIKCGPFNDPVLIGRIQSVKVWERAGAARRARAAPELYKGPKALSIG